MLITCDVPGLVPVCSLGVQRTLPGESHEPRARVPHDLSRLSSGYARTLWEDLAHDDDV
jgi:hypothetical protein